MSTPNRPVRAVAYLRVARPDDDALEHQSQDVRTYAAEHGYDLVAEFTDTGTATQAQPREFAALLSYVRTHHVQACLIDRFDRLARSYPAHAARTAQLREAGVDVAYVRGPDRSVRLLFDILTGEVARHG